MEPRPTRHDLLTARYLTGIDAAHSHGEAISAAEGTTPSVRRRAHAAGHVVDGPRRWTLEVTPTGRAWARHVLDAEAAHVRAGEIEAMVAEIEACNEEGLTEIVDPEGYAAAAHDAGYRAGDLRPAAEQLAAS